MAYVDKQNRNKLKKNSKVKTYFIKKRRKPLVLVFDEKEREDFLTGFRKRKVQRKKKAQEELEAELKIERKRIRQEAKDALKKLVARPDDPVIGEVYADAEVVDMGTHQVHVTELDPLRLAKENNWIGSNQIKYEMEEDICKKEDNADDESSEIHGMETSKKQVAKGSKAGKTPLADNLRTTKDIKKLVKQAATKKVQKSKAFQRKKDIEKVQNKKKKAREERKQDGTSKKSRKKRNRNRNVQS